MPRVCVLEMTGGREAPPARGAVSIDVCGIGTVRQAEIGEPRHRVRAR